jgi:anaerobic magnesium-protoporphyrin IX monomethyl ester cyclase
MSGFLQEHKHSDCGVKQPMAALPSPIMHRQCLQKVLLIQPPAFSNNMRTDMNPNAPLGLAYIAGILEREKYDVQILDAFIEGWEHETRISEEKILVGLSFQRIKEIIVDVNPDVVGITSMFTSQRKNAHQIAKIVKEVDSEIVVIFGGAHPTSAFDSVLDDPCVDVAVLGEGDNLIVPLIRSIEEGNDIRKLDGIAYRDEAGNAVEIQKVTQINDLDELPFPARHLLPMEKYFAAGIRHGGSGKGQRAASMITSRGCQFLCNFCTAFKVFTRKPRMRSIENVLAEIDELQDKYNIDEIFFEDDQIIAKQRRAGDLFDAIGDRYNLHWDTPNGVSPWLLNDEILGKMKKSGCYRVNIAIESGNQWVLDNIINKPVKVNMVPELVKTIRRHGMEVGTFLVVGNIGRDAVETLDQVKDSFSFCRKIRVTPHISLLTAYPGSEVLNIAMEKGYLVPGFDWDNLIIQKFQLQTPLWTPQELMSVVETEKVKMRWQKMFYYPKKTFLNILDRLTSDPMSLFIEVGFAAKVGIKALVAACENCAILQRNAGK